jgi:hypothetical protein
VLRHGDVWKTEGIAPPILTSALDEDKWSAPHLGRFTPGETASCIHCIGGWVVTREDLDVMAKRKLSCPCRELNPGRIQHVAIPTKRSRLIYNIYKAIPVKDRGDP